MANTTRYFTKGIELRGETSDLSNNVEGTIWNNSTSARLKLYIGAAVREIITADQVQILTNKTIDASANTVSNLTTSMLASGVLNTSTSLATASDAQVPSALAVKSYVDAGLALQNDASEIAFVPNGDITSTNVQAAIVEVRDDTDTKLTSKVDKTTTVNGYALSSNVTLAKTDVGLGNVDNTSDATKNAAAVNLTNKTIDTATNTITGLANSSIATGAAISRTKLASGTANVVLANNGSGVMSEITDFTVGTNNLTLASTKHLEIQAASDNTTTGAAASLTAFTGGAIRLTNSSLLSLANIPAGANGQQLVLFNRTGAAVSIIDSSAASGTAANRIYTGTSANISFAKDSALILSYDSTSARWQVVGGSGSGGSSELPLDTLAQQTFESATLTDFTQTGLTLVTASNLLIKNAKTAQLLSNASTTQSFKQVITVDNEFKGRNLSLSLYTRSSATQGNVTILVYDETNAANLAASQPITLNSQSLSATTNTSTSLTGIAAADINKLKVGQTITGSGITAGTTIASINTTTLTATLSQAATAAATVTLRISDLPQRQSFSFDVPTNCSSLSYTISALAESGSPESYFDDIAIKMTATALTSTSISQTTFNATDWTAYTPTFTGFGTVSTSNLKYRQIGTSIEIEGTFAVGTCTATEQRISFPNSLLTSSSVATLEVAGAFALNQGAGSNFSYLVLREPSVSYMTFGVQSASNTALSKIASATPLPTSGGVISIKASFPIAGLTTSTTTSTTIPLTTAQLVQTPDSYLRINAFTASFGSTATRVVSLLTNQAIRDNIGNAIQYQDDSINGARFTALQDGEYKFDFETNYSSTGSVVFLTKNSVSLTSVFSSVPASEVIGVDYATSIFRVKTSVILKTGDIVRIHADTANFTSGYSHFSASFAGSLKQLNASSDSKIVIPTHSLRFEGASARGSIDTAIVKFDTQAITQGDAWDVVNTAANGTVITMKKAGKLAVSSTIYLATTGYTFITKNQATLTTNPVITEIVASTYGNANQVYNASGTVDVVVGDKIRIATNITPTTDFENRLTLSLTENSIPANFSNVLPQWSQSDSCIQLNTANGYGLISTFIERFANTQQNIGADVSYSDSASLGSTFTINSDGVYAISYCTSFSTASNYIGLSKNTTNAATGVQNIASSERLALSVSASSANYPVECSWSGFLSKGDVIRPHNTASTAGVSGGYTHFTISKVGKPNLTSVDVTPFVNTKTTDTEAILASGAQQGWGSTNTGVSRFPAILKNTNKGILQLIQSSTLGDSIVALKDCTIVISASTENGTGGAGGLIVVKNSPATTTPTNPAYNTILQSSTVGAGLYISLSTSTVLNAGDVVKILRDTTNVPQSMSLLSITATADNNATASPTQQVSSDTMSFAFKSTAIAATDPIGTFNTYTYTANTNTATISASAPTQSTSSMNTNGIQLFGRAFNVASTTASPARVDIFIGTGLKSYEALGYVSANKITAFAYDRFVYGTATEMGTSVFYNEITGILTLNAAIGFSGSIVTRYVDNGENGNTSGYFVFNASKSPSLVTIPNQLQRIAYLSEQQASGTAGGTSVATTWTNRILNTVNDPTGLVTSLASNQFVLPAGTYDVQATAPMHQASMFKLRVRNITDSTTLVVGESSFTGSTISVSPSAPLKGQFTITSAKTVSLQYYAGNAKATDGLGVATSSGEVEVYAQISIQKVK